MEIVTAVFDPPQIWKVLADTSISKSFEEDSEKVADVSKETMLEVVAKKGRRLQIAAPTEGWCTAETESGDIVVQYESDKRSPETNSQIHIEDNAETQKKKLIEVKRDPSDGSFVASSPASVTMTEDVGGGDVEQEGSVDGTSELEKLRAQVAAQDEIILKLQTELNQLKGHTNYALELAGTNSTEIENLTAMMGSSVQELKGDDC